MRARRGRQSGQALLEYVLVFTGVVMPLTFGLFSVAELIWTWHSVVDYTRLGARYAATHCWQADGANVATWMRRNAPAVPDQQAFADGSVQITVEYFRRNPDSGQLEEFSCDGDCSPQCVPDMVRVGVSNYEFRKFFTYLGLPPVPIPNFSTAVPVEGAGCDPEQGTCNP